MSVIKSLYSCIDMELSNSSYQHLDGVNEIKSYCFIAFSRSGIVLDVIYH